MDRLRHHRFPLPPGLRRTMCGALLILLALPGAAARAQSDESVEDAGDKQLLAAIDKAKGEFRPFDTQQLATTKTRLMARLNDLDQLLKRSSAGFREGWHEYLGWADLHRELSQDEGDLAVLQAVHKRFFADYDGLEMKQFRAARAALGDYLAMAGIDRIPNLETVYQQYLDELARQIRSGQLKTDQPAAYVVGQIARWLEAAGQAPEVVRLVRRRYRGPNLQLRLSASLLRGVRRPVDEVSPVNDVILGTQIRGTATTRGTVNFFPQAAEGSLAIGLNFDAIIHSQNRGYNRGVTIDSQGTTYVQATQALYVDEHGITTGAATACATTCTALGAICAKRQLIQKIATRQAQKSLPEAQQIASRRAEQRVEEQLSEQTAELVAEANQKYVDKVRNPLLRRGIFPRELHLQSDSDAATVVAETGTDSQLTALMPPPELPVSADIVLHLHESLVGNVAETLLAGVHLTDERIAELFEEMSGSVPPELEIKDDEDPWSLTFDFARPIRVSFQDDVIRVSVVGQRFSRRRQAIRRTAEITAAYQLRAGENGPELIRQGDVEVRFPDKKALLAPEFALRSLLRSKFRGIFKEKLDGSELSLPEESEENVADLGTLKLKGHVARDGWLVLAMDREETDSAGAPETATQVTHASR